MAGTINGKGGKTLMPPFDIPHVGRIALMSDPQGAPFYIMKPIPPAGVDDATSRVFNPEALGKCAWNELYTSGPVEALDFYASLFDWEKGSAMPMGEMGIYQLYEKNSVETGAVMQVEAGMPPSWNFYFRVRDIDASAAIISAEGGSVLHGPVEVPGGDWVLVALDPQQAMFSICGKKKA